MPKLTGGRLKGEYFKGKPVVIFPGKMTTGSTIDSDFILTFRQAKRYIDHFMVFHGGCAVARP